MREWDRVGGVLLMGYEMFRLLTNPRKTARANQLAQPQPPPPPTNFGIFSGYPGMPGSGLHASASTSALFPAPAESTSSKRRKRAITIDIEKEEKEEHMLVG